MVLQEVRVFSLLLFGFELPMLRLHLLQTAPHLHAVLVAEAAMTFQGGSKPAHLTEALARGTVPMAHKLRVAVVSSETLQRHCGALLQTGGYRAARCLETHQRARLFRMLFDAASADDVALLCDVDEIATPQTLWRLQHAPPDERDHEARALRLRAVELPQREEARRRDEKNEAHA